MQTPWSLKSLADNQHRRWSKNNRILQSIELTYLDREFLFWSEHVGRFCLSLIILQLLLLWLWAIWPGELLGQSWPPAMPWLSWGTSEQIGYFTALWSAQATMVALVYPIVIAFVAVFLQIKPNSEVFLNVYVIDSVALPSGLSSILLVAVMGFQYLLAISDLSSILPAFVALDTGWFILNVLLTSYFLLKTILFLQPAVQWKVIRRYAIRVALPREMFRKKAYEIFAQSQYKEWVAGRSYFDREQGEGPSIELCHQIKGGGREEIKIVFRKPTILSNVRFFPLNILLKSWLRRARLIETDGKRSFMSEPMLTIGIVPGRIYSDESVTISVHNGPALSRLEKALFRLAYNFQTVGSGKFEISVNSVVSELVREIVKAAETRDIESFREGYFKLDGLILDLLSASLSCDGLVHSNPVDLEEDTSYIQWLDSYRPIFQATVEMISVDIKPFCAICLVARRLNGDVLEFLSAKVRGHVMKLPPLLMYELGEWWSQKIEEQGQTDHGHYRKAAPRPPLAPKYEKAIASFIGSWENLRTEMAEIPDPAEGFEWEQASNIAELPILHVEETALMLMGAIFRGDAQAACWLADSLNKWWIDDHSFEPFCLYSKTDFITLSHLKMPWPDVLSDLGVVDIGQERDEVIQYWIVIHAVKNYWQDIRLVCLELMLSWTSDCESPISDSLAVEIAIGILSGQEWREGGTSVDGLAGMNAEQYLIAKIRQYAADGKGRGGYEGRLSQIVRRIQHIQGVDMISSRVYTSRGFDDLRSLSKEQVYLFSILAGKSWVMPNTLMDMIDLWFNRNAPSHEILKHLIQQHWMPAFRERTARDGEVIEMAISLSGRRHTDAEGLQHAKQSISDLNALLGERLRNEIERAEVSQNRLNEIGRLASTIAFDKAKGKFPINLFADISYSSDLDFNKTLRFMNIDKGELTEQPMSAIPINADSYWSDVMAQFISSHLLRDILEANPNNELEANTATTYWEAIQREVAHMVKAGRSPILILENPTRPEWIWQWQNDNYSGRYPVPVDMQVQRREGWGDGYVCHLNEIAVYSSSQIGTGRSVLIAKEAFNKVTFRRTEQGSLVDVRATPTKDSKVHVDVMLAAGMKVQPCGHVWLQITYTNNGE